MSAPRLVARTQRGVALVTSMLLLMILTIIAVSMFRSFGSQERIAGNLREKDRALHAALSIQQYAEWWLTQPAGAIAAQNPVACVVTGPLNGNAGQGQICTKTTSLANLLGGPAAVTQRLPWPAGYVQYSPAGMTTPTQAGTNGDPAYAWTPGFYIVDLGVAADAAGEAYQIDAFSSGGTTGTVAVVESTYEVQQGVVNRGGL